LVQCLWGENIFTLARKVEFSGFLKGEDGTVKAGFVQCFRGLKQLFEFHKILKKCDTESTAANVYGGDYAFHAAENCKFVIEWESRAE